MKIRSLEQSEIKILYRLLYEAIFIPKYIEKPPFDIIHQPQLQVYINDFGKKEDDCCLVADIAGQIVGGVWVRITSGNIRGFGYIDNQTPELAISLFNEYRNQGIGTKLMIAMIKYLQNKKYKQCSLAVEKTNYAIKMYQSIGFQIIRETDKDFLMLLTL